jgi:putative ABC transport system permease protein
MTGYARTLLLFYRRNLRIQPLRELMALLGVAAGVALLFAVQVAHRSVTGSFEAITHGVAGRATLEVAARGARGFDQRVLREVQAIPGVGHAAPLLEQSVVVVGPRGRRPLKLLGATEQLAQLGGTLARPFIDAGHSAGGGLLLLTAPTAQAIGASTGQPVTLQLGARSEKLVVAAALSSAKIGAVAESPVAATPLPVLQYLAGEEGRLSRVLIEPRRGREATLRGELQRRFGTTLNVRSVSSEAQLLDNAVGPEKQVTLLFSAISLVAGMILAYNALLLASEPRRRFIVNLIQQGTPEPLIVASLAFDALLLGLAGSLLGLLGGELISRVAFHSLPGYLAAAFPLGQQHIVSATTVLIAVGGGMLAALVAALLPSLVALRAGAAAEPSAVGSAMSFAERLRLSDSLSFACGVLLLAVSIVLSATAPTTTVLALVGLAAGLVICLPTLLRILLAAANSAARRSGDPAIKTSLAELRSSPARSVALLATGTIAVLLVVLIGGSVADVQRAARTGAGDLLSSAELWLKPGGEENVYTTQPFASGRIERRLTALAGVDSVLPWRDSFLDLQHRRVWVLGVPRQVSAQIAPSQLIDGGLREADAKLRAGGWAAVSEPIAREYRVQVGQPITLPTPTGSARLRVAAIIANYGWLPGAIVMNAQEHARLWDSSEPTQLAVTLGPDISLQSGKAAVQHALGTDALTVQTAQQRRDEVGAVLGNTLSRLSDTTLVVLVVTVFSVIVLMLSAIWQRRARLSALKATGWSNAQLGWLIFLESGTVLLCGSLIGVVFGLIGQYLIDGWLHGATGASVKFSPAWLLGLRTLAIVAAISLLATAIAMVRAAEPSAPSGLWRKRVSPTGEWESTS